MLFTNIRSLLLLLSIAFSGTYAASCLCAPTEACWPSAQDWNTLNKTVQGRLVKSVPLATPCHGLNYNGEACEKVKNDWKLPQYHINDSSSVLSPLFANNSCSPFTAPDDSCTQGKYTQYAIAVSNAADVKNGIAFAKRFNVRLVIRNTGHCLLGKSTGYGSLALWTHHLKDIEFLDDWNNQGPAVTIGAGVQGGDLVAAAEAHGRVVVTGGCATVGVAGGFLQGGGHSPLSNLFGLAADNALEFTVVTAAGVVLVANAYNANSDLFWALSGGGGGTFGVVLSVTIKTHEDFKVSGTVIKFSAVAGTDDGMENWWEAVHFYHSEVPKYTEAGAYGIASYTADGDFQVEPLIAPHLSSEELAELLQPFFDKLSEFGISYTATIGTYPTFNAAYTALFPPFVVDTTQIGGRMIQRSALEKNKEGLEKAIREIIEGGALVYDVALRPTLAVGEYPDNAVNPAWRDTDMLFLVAYAWNATSSPEFIKEQRNNITNVWGEKLRQLTPGSGSYLNEADVNEPNWQSTFYGSKYPRLFRIKKKYDSKSFFYARTAVGSEAWVEQEDGKLCRNNKRFKQDL